MKRSNVSLGRNSVLAAALLGTCGLAVGQASSGAFGGGASGEASAQQIFDEFVGGPLTNCFFKYGPTGRDPLSNRAFPDAGATYWTAVYVRPPGSKVELEGYFPNARFTSLISYDKAGLYVDGVADGCRCRRIGIVTPRYEPSTTLVVA